MLQLFSKSTEYIDSICTVVLISEECVISKQPTLKSNCKIAMFFDGTKFHNRDLRSVKWQSFFIQFFSLGLDKLSSKNNVFAFFSLSMENALFHSSLGIKKHYHHIFGEQYKLQFHIIQFLCPEDYKYILLWNLANPANNYCL